jgi:hypothetical protein
MSAVAVLVVLCLAIVLYFLFSARDKKLTEGLAGLRRTSLLKDVSATADNYREMKEFQKRVEAEKLAEEAFFRQLSLCVRTDSVVKRFVKNETYEKAFEKAAGDAAGGFDPDLTASLARLMQRYEIPSFINENPQLRTQMADVLEDASKARTKYLAKWRNHFEKDPLEDYLDNPQGRFILALLRAEPGDDYFGALLEYGRALETPLTLYAHNAEVAVLEVLTGEDPEALSKLEPPSFTSDAKAPLKNPVFLNALRVPGRAQEFLDLLEQKFNPETHPDVWRNLDYDRLAGWLTIEAKEQKAQRPQS